MAAASPSVLARHFVSGHDVAGGDYSDRLTGRCRFESDCQDDDVRGLVLGAWAGRPRLDRGAAGWRIVDRAATNCLMTSSDMGARDDEFAESSAHHDARADQRRASLGQGCSADAALQSARDALAGIGSFESAAAIRAERDLRDDRDRRR